LAIKRALKIARSENFSAWYQELVREADLAENSAVRGCMVIRPWGYGIWELIQQGLDRRFKETGHENCYFPLFIPLSFIAKEAEHVEGFAKEMAVVTHHRLKTIDGELKPDPDAELTEPLIVRPTSETIIADSFRNWIKSYRDLPVLTNQWANVVRWEMRTRLFLRTAEFLWQEGHTAHVDREDAFAETMRMIEVYRDFVETDMGMPVIVGEKTANERFPGADNTFSIEAMMQDGKALQAGTSHYLGTHFAEAQGIKYQAADGTEKFAHTTSWGASTRLIGALIMTHGDDDGLRLPPVVAPKQVIIVPRLRGDGSDGELLTYCDGLQKQLRAQSALGRAIRVGIDTKDKNASQKRWDYVRRGVPLILEIGSREAANRDVSFLRRDQLYTGEKASVTTQPLDAFVAGAARLLEDIQKSLFSEARTRMESRIQSGIKSMDDVRAYFGAAGTDDEEESAGGSDNPGWLRVAWSKPQGAELEAVVARLAPLKVTIRNAPIDQPERHGACVFTGKPGVEDILIARAY
jgi:prolyl-tRNA synthetase